MASEHNHFTRDIVVVGGSSGAFGALKFIADLPSDFPAALFLVLHIAAEGPGLLPQLIARFSKLRVEHASHGETIARGRIYVAPPDHHLSVADGIIEVARGPKDNRHRPSIDVLFRSAASVYGPRVIGIVLSGLLDDGSAGLFQIRTRGGLGIVQEDALFSQMPNNALAHAGADHRVPHSQLAALLTELVTQKVSDQMSENVGQKPREQNVVNEVKTPSNLSCPDCGGVLSRIDDSQMLRFTCRVGHTYSADTLLAAQSENVEQALWTAVRLLEEKAEMARKLREYSLGRNFKSAPKKFDKQAKKLEADANVIRELLKRAEGGESEQG
jgi:two-component system chemotaxis response regulator CheB